MAIDLKFAYEKYYLVFIRYNCIMYIFILILYFPFTKVLSILTFEFLIYFFGFFPFLINNKEIQLKINCHFSVFI